MQLAGLVQQKPPAFAPGPNYPQTCKRGLPEILRTAFHLETHQTEQVRCGPFQPLQPQDVVRSQSSLSYRDRSARETARGSSIDFNNGEKFLRKWLEGQQKISSLQLGVSFRDPDRCCWFSVDLALAALQFRRSCPGILTVLESSSGQMSIMLADRRLLLVFVTWY